MLNQAYILKLVWQTIANRDKLWVKIMRTKYNCGIQNMSIMSYRQNSSSMWKAIVKAWEVVENNSSWIIRHGRDARFWRDAWIPGCGKLE